MEGELIALVSVSAVVLFCIGVPIFLIIAHWVLWTSVITDFTLANLSLTLFEGINFFGLLALPLFILTGDIINAAGIAKRLTDFAYALLGWVRGGLGLAALGACGMFSAISGSNAATTATIGSIMYKELKEGKYDDRFSAATLASGGVVGIIIPPSIIFVIYGFLLNLPIGDLFMAGLLPGALMIVGMQIVCLVLSWKFGWGTVQPLRLGNCVRTGLRAYLGFVAIAIVLLGIYGGIFSPTEAAAMTVVFGLFAGVAITREIKPRAIPKVLLHSGQIAGLLVPLVAVSIVMQQLLSIIGAPAFVAGLFDGVGGYYATMMICMAMILVTGCFLESVPVVIILAPILAPIAYGVGVDPTHFAIIFVAGTAIGFITPPFGLNLFVASSITGVPFLRIVPFVVPYFIVLLLSWLAIVGLPELSTYLPSISGM
ncbi:TRAP transporter large permease [Marivibrio halodurans]|uniref:TRAP transporter large permease protein n=1 Tax=Marivibrio halodurans TaxID=2039722 RepID=A0A8J7V089_9PROT|nr:TRAP transporter large permease [Marivibrio halodurans]MBP5856531.1 TRAP transporter large permease [Marivibrio halodurans]